MNVKPLIIIQLILMKLTFINSVVYLRGKNERGPLAWHAGEECIGAVSTIFFYDQYSSRTKNAIVLHTHNLSSPAAEIENIYLTRINDLFREFHGERYQLRVISDKGHEGNANEIHTTSSIVTPCDFYIFVIDDIEKLYTNLLNYITRSISWNPAGKFLVLYNNPLNRTKSYDIAYEIFSMMSLKYHATNVIVLVATGVTTYDIYKSDPFSGENCQDMLAIKIGVCDDGKFDDPKYFDVILRKPRVKSDLKKCTFKLCATVIEPFVEEGCDTGLEIQFIQILKEVMGFKLITNCTSMGRGVFLENKTTTGLLAKLVSNECHFIVGGFYPDDEVHDCFGFTFPYFEDSYTWFVPIAKFRPRWEGLITIFEPHTWLVFFMILILCGVSWYILGKFPPEDVQHKHVVLCFLNAFCVFLGVSANNRPSQGPLRVFFIMLAIYGLNVTTIYTSKLIAVFQSRQRTHQIHTVAEILDSGIPYGGRLEYLDWFENGGVEDTQVFESYNESFAPNRENLQSVEDGHLILLANHLFVMATGYSDDIYEFTDDVFSNPLEMITIRGFPLLPKMNQIIGHIRDSGLSAKIYNDYMYNISIIRNMIEIMNKTSKRLEIVEIVLTTEHLEGPFLLYVCGTVFSVFIFIIELITVSPLRGYVEQGWRYMEKKWSLTLVKIGLKEKQLPKMNKFKKRKGVSTRS